MPTFGAATNLIANTITLTLPRGTVKYWYLQNQDTAPLLVTFPVGSGFGPVALDPATVTGGAGDWLDSIGFPWPGGGTNKFSGLTVVLTSTIATAQFGSGVSIYDEPINIYPVNLPYGY